ncbi:hypothetical protein LCGC14_1490190 [marine sediment metagenome]|uniref:Uncharacterized protein n=1 Tax=marine sediment metagenome TaxID=412755 RepID=A0A0F9M8Q3_9ZZZZ
MGTYYVIHHSCDAPRCDATIEEEPRAWYPGMAIHIPGRVADNGYWRRVETDRGSGLICPRHVVTIEERKPE